MNINYVFKLCIGRRNQIIKYHELQNGILFHLAWNMHNMQVDI